MSTYVLAINDHTLDLIEFLNDGVRPVEEEKPTFYIFEVNSPRESTGKIVTESEMRELDDTKLIYTTVTV